MKEFEDIKVILRGKSGKKLAALSLGIFLLITAIVFFAAFRLCETIHMKQIEDYLGEIQRVVDSSMNELHIRGGIYDKDVLTRAELGLKIYAEHDGMTEAEKLERVRGAVSAASISLLDGQRQLVASTGIVSPEANFSACVQALEPRTPRLELYRTALKDGQGMGKNEGKGFVLLPVAGTAGQSLVFEFGCDTMLEMYDAIDSWSIMLGRVLASGEAAAWIKTGDRVEGYPEADLTAEQTSRLNEELRKVFQNSASRSVSLLGRRYLTAQAHYPQKDTDILLTVPMKSVVNNGVYIAGAISAIIGLGIVLIQIYVFRRLLREKDEKGGLRVTFKWVFQATWPGILVTFAVTFVFSTMLLLLENRTNAAFFAVSDRESLQNEIVWRKDQEGSIRNSFADSYRARAQTLAAFLTEHPDLQTRAGLEELSRIAGSEYLMRFDKAGQEVFSSNSYTGFSVGDNLSEEYKAVLMGYPSAVVGPEADPYTKETQIGTAVLMTDSEGQPDGFLLAVYSAVDMAAELKRMELKNTVNHFVVQKGHIAAAINDKDGTFIAHTDPEMIGQRAEDWLADVKPGSSFEGFTEYGRENVYVSAVASEGTTILFMVPATGDSYVRTFSLLMVLAVLLILVLMYYPTAAVLSAKAMAHAKTQASVRQENPMIVFYDGYVVFMTLFALFVLVASSCGWWTSFDYILSVQWSKGVHLFSLWAALFVLAITLFCLYVIRSVLSLVEHRLSLRSKTITRLATSLITYIAIIYLAFSILNMFGVNTTAMLASAGIISIAVGMGAQSMAADLLAGFFMMLEGSVHVGDQVSVGNVKGCVTDMGIRTTEITDDEGNVVILNNSKVTGLSNKSRKKGNSEES